MRKIDKTQFLSTKYKEWEESLVVPHKKFSDTTTRKEYYRDVLMNLYHCQSGLCAYTETELFVDDWDFYAIENWDKGRYKQGDVRHEGEIDHFNPDLKESEAWKWDNLFVINAKVNRIKGILKIDERLKPDAPDYDPFKMLQYDVEKHVFIPHVQTYSEEGDQEVLVNSLFNLGVNFFQEDRRRVHKSVMMQIELGVETWQTVDLSRYPTAFAMIKKHYKSNAI